MKIDHIVMNVSNKYQNDLNVINDIRNGGVLYEPKYGKGTKGFKATNLWFGVEYFEMINILKEDGGGWIPKWTEMYNAGHRGVVCIFLDVADINEEYNRISQTDIKVTKPEWLKFKWFFNLFTRTMPWMNSYIEFFEGVPLQLGFQQMKDQKSRDFMNQYMFPNSKDEGVEGITSIEVYGNLTNRDIDILKVVFKDKITIDGNVIVKVNESQKIIFIESDVHKVIVNTRNVNDKTKGNVVKIENVEVNL